MTDIYLLFSITVFIRIGSIFSFNSRFEQYGLDPSRNETGRYRARMNSQQWYVCHYQSSNSTKGTNAENYQSDECIKQNKDARDQQEISNALYPYFYPNKGAVPGCLTPERLNNGRWDCQRPPETSWRIVPVYHSCLPICVPNFTLSAPLRDFRCTEARQWDGDVSKVYCKANLPAVGNDGKSVTTSKGDAVTTVPKKTESNETDRSHEQNNNDSVTTVPKKTESNETDRSHEQNNNDSDSLLLGILIAGVVVVVVIVVAVVVAVVVTVRVWQSRHEISSSSSDSSNEILVIVGSAKEDKEEDHSKQSLIQNEDQSPKSVELSLQEDNANKLKGDRGIVSDSDSVNKILLAKNGSCNDDPCDVTVDTVNFDDKQNEKYVNYEKIVDIHAVENSDGKRTIQSEVSVEGSGEGNPCTAVPQQCHEVTKEVPAIDCYLTIDDLMDMQNSLLLISNLGDMLDPSSKRPDNWKGFAKFVLGLTDCRIKAVEYRTKERGHFQSLIDEMKANGITVGHLIYYFSQDENKRSDVIHEIAKYHTKCSFCCQFYKG